MEDHKNPDPKPENKNDLFFIFLFANFEQIDIGIEGLLVFP